MMAVIFSGSYVQIKHKTTPEGLLLTCINLNPSMDE